MNKDLEYKFVTELEDNQNIVTRYARCTRMIGMPITTFFKRSPFSFGKSKRSILTQDYESVIFRITADEYDATEEEQLKLMYRAV